MLVNVLSTRNGGGFNYGASPLQMAFLTFPEFFNTIFLNILVLSGVGAWLYKSKIRWNLIVITVVTLVVGIVGSAITPTFPRYLMSAAIVILLFACVGIV
jgi:mannose/fructose/N-acetylgalactosamine-specific phosphotransferase system component IID